MNKGTLDYQSKFKENIELLINHNELEQAKGLLIQYEHIEKDDIDIYSMKAIIAIVEGNIDEAEQILLKGLEINNTNYDLMFNIAYVYELKEEYMKSLIYYRRALRMNYYDIDITQIENKIQELKRIINNNVDDQFILNNSKLDNILFIDFDNNKKTNALARRIAEYGINVDIAYAGTDPAYNVSTGTNPYRKILGIVNISDLIEYAKYYNYDIIQTFNMSKEIKKAFKTTTLKFIDKDLFYEEISSVIDYYSKNRLQPYTKYTYVEAKDITIVVPTYNRSYYLKRLLTFMNNYKYIKPKILVLDSSYEEEKKENKKTIDAIGNKNVRYEEFSSDIYFYNKLNMGVNDINTKYITLCADDDFLTEEAIIESIKMLDKEESLYSVKGKNNYFIDSMGNLIEYDWFYGLTEKKPVDRLRNITQGFVSSLIYQVFKADKFKKMYLFIEKNRANMPENDTFIEYLFYFMVICTGKIGKINVDLNIRDKSVANEMEIKNFPHAVVDGTFNENYKRFCDFLKEYLLYLGEDVENFEIEIRSIFIDFLVNFLKVPRKNVSIKDNQFDMEALKIGMKKSWCWPAGL